MLTELFDKKFYFLWMGSMFLIAPIFIALKFLRYEVISQSQADQIVAWLLPVWPVLALQYSNAQRNDPLGARLYALLIVVTLIAVVLLFVCVVGKYYLAHKSIPRPTWRDSIVLAVAIFMYFFLAFLDTPGTAGRAFHADDFGIYYFRQNISLAGFGITMLVGCLMMLRLAGEGLQRFRGSDSA